MTGLSDGERILMICSAVLIQYTRVTDGRTDGQTDRQTDGIGVAYTRYSIYAVARKNQKTHKLILNKFDANTQRGHLYLALLTSAFLSCSTCFPTETKLSTTIKSEYTLLIKINCGKNSQVTYFLFHSTDV